MGHTTKREAILEVLIIMRDAIDSLPALQALHPGDPVYDEAIEVAKDRVHEAVDNLIIDVETEDDQDEEQPPDGDDDEEDA